MNYLVMECHVGYAVVLDETGRFLKVANMNYEVGQHITDVIPISTPAQTHSIFSKRMMSIASLAACFCILILASWSLIFSPYGSVRMRINPELQIYVNRFDYVVGLKGLNEDGKDLIESYSYLFKKVDLVSEELSDLAVAMGYLKEGGEIHLLVTSKHADWKRATKDRLLIELNVYTGESINVLYDEDDDTDSSSPSIVIPAPSQPSTEKQSEKSTQSTSSSNNTEDDDDDDDDDDDNDIDDNDDDDETGTTDSNQDDDDDDKTGSSNSNQNDDDDETELIDSNQDDDDDNETESIDSNQDDNDETESIDPNQDDDETESIDQNQDDDDMESPDSNGDDETESFIP